VVVSFFFVVVALILKVNKEREESTDDANVM